MTALASRIRLRCVLLLVLTAGAGCNLQESPTSPASDAASSGPRYSFGGGSGTLFGSTNQGELVEIDLDLGTVTLIGDVGTYAGKTLGWTDIAQDASGALFALSRHSSESDTDCFGGPCNHLYEIDPQNGAVVADGPKASVLNADLLSEVYETTLDLLDRFIKAWARSTSPATACSEPAGTISGSSVGSSPSIPRRPI